MASTELDVPLRPINVPGVPSFIARCAYSLGVTERYFRQTYLKGKSKEELAALDSSPLEPEEVMARVLGQ